MADLLGRQAGDTYHLLGRFLFSSSFDNTPPGSGQHIRDRITRQIQKELQKHRLAQGRQSRGCKRWVQERFSRILGEMRPTAKVRRLGRDGKARDEMGGS